MRGEERTCGPEPTSMACATWSRSVTSSGWVKSRMACERDGWSQTSQQVLWTAASLLWCEDGRVSVEEMGEELLRRRTGVKPGPPRSGGWCTRRLPVQSHLECAAGRPGLPGGCGESLAGEVRRAPPPRPTSSPSPRPRATGGPGCRASSIWAARAEQRSKAGAARRRETGV